MKHQHFDVGTAGFYGAYWACAGGSDCAVIAMIGDDPEDRLARSAAKWLCGRGVNVLTMSPAKKDYGHHNYPLERMEAAISWLKANGNKKIGIAGASTTGTLALTAAAMFPEITLTIAMTPSDFVWQGFMQGKKDGCKEWPVEGESLFSYAGKPLPYMPFCYQHPDYWHCIAAESKRTGDMVNSRKLFDDSEAAHPIEPEEYIPVENIHGKLLLIGAEDDVLWDAARYIHRMEKRLAEKPHECEVETAVYAHGTHFVFPEGMLKIMLPVGAGLFVRLAFQAAKQFPEACRQTRQDMVGPAGPRCEHVFRELYESASYAERGFLQLKVLELMLLLGRIPQERAADPYCSAEQTALAHHLRDHLLTNREGYVSLAQLAAEHAISVSHLQKLFKQTYGMPVYHYIKEYRLEQAAVELVRSRKPITEIAQHAGYDNASKFSESFKKRYRKTPSRYRADKTNAVKRSIETKTE